MRISAIVFVSILFVGCIRIGTETGSDGMQAYVPVYARLDTVSLISIKTFEPAPTVKAGKIYAYGNYIFQNEINKGIHVIENMPGSTAKKIGFVSIPFNTDMAMRGKYMYANSINNLVVIDMSDPMLPILVKTIKNAFPLINQTYPPASGYFVCADPGKGIVVDWQLQTVQTAACRR
jgi:hypothetical protein